MPHLSTLLLQNFYDSINMILHLPHSIYLYKRHIGKYFIPTGLRNFSDCREMHFIVFDLAKIAFHAVGANSYKIEALKLVIPPSGSCGWNSVKVLKFILHTRLYLALFKLRHFKLENEFLGDKLGNCMKLGDEMLRCNVCTGAFLSICENDANCSGREGACFVSSCSVSKSIYFLVMRKETLHATSVLVVLC